MRDNRSKDPRKVAKQDRSRATLDAVFAAMDVIVERSGIDGFSLVEVAREAGVGRPSIYDYFPTREALVAAWEERVIAREMARIVKYVEGLIVDPPPFEVSIVELVDVVVVAFGRHAQRFHYREQLELTARSSVRSEMLERIVVMMAAALARAPDRARLRVDRLDVAARLGVHAVFALARTVALTTWSHEEQRLHRRELATMIYRYLLRDPADVTPELRAPPP